MHKSFMKRHENKLKRCANKITKSRIKRRPTTPTRLNKKKICMNIKLKNIYR